MRVGVSVLLLSAVLVGCVTQPQSPPKPREPIVVGPTPECSSKDECDAMWLRAIESLQLATGMKIQTMSDMYLQTYTSRRVPEVSGSAQKVPLGDGRYAIRASFVSRYGSQDLTDSMLALFNLQVTNAGKLYKMK